MNDQFYPLAIIENTDLQNLCEVLWGWELCPNCRTGQSCNHYQCAWKRSARLASYFDYYKKIASAYVPDRYGNQPALSSHRDIVKIIQLIKSRPNDQRSQLTHQYFSQRVLGTTMASNTQSTTRLPSLADQQRAFNLAAKVMSMISCSAEKLSLAVLDLELQKSSSHLPWHDDTTFSTFIERRIPRVSAGGMSGTINARFSRAIESGISARRLEKLARLSFRGTEDLGCHLQLDSGEGVVYIYHYTSVLKEHLLAAKSSAETM